MEFDYEELLALAQHDMERGQLEGALRKLKQVVQHDAPPPNALALAGKLYAQLGLFSYAKGVYERYLAVIPQWLEITFELGMVNFDMGDEESALSIWSKLLNDSPIFPPALFYAALALSRAGRIAEAKRNLDVLLQTAQVDNLYFSKAKELLQAIDAQAAKQSEQVLPSNPYPA